MKRWIPWTLAVLLLGLLVAGALRSLEQRRQQRAELAAASQPVATSSIELQAGDLARAELKRLPLELPLTGSLRPARSAMVKARVSGELRELNVREGDSVRAGQVLGRIDDSEYQSRLRQAQEQARAARAQVDIAQRQFDNNQALVRQGFISATALQTSEASLNAARATHQAALAAVELTRKALEDAVLKSPMDGQISQRLAQPGERVGVESRIVEVVDLGSLELEAPLPAGDALQARLGQRAQLQVEGSDQRLGARIARINPSAQPGSRSVLSYLTLDDTAGLRSGMFVRGQLQVGEREGVAVPLDAVRTDKPTPYVQVLQDGSIVHQPVTVSERVGLAQDPLALVQGLPAGSLVLRGSTGALPAGTLVKRMPDASAGEGSPPATALSTRDSAVATR